jgi:CHRD domain
MRQVLTRVMCAAAWMMAGAAIAGADQGFSGNLSATQEVPPNGSVGTGRGFVILDAAESQITVLMNFTALTANASAGHIHGPAPVGVNGPIIFNLNPPPVMAGAITPQTFAVTAQQVADLKAGLWYFNIHTATFPGGEIRGQIAPAQSFTAKLAGTQEVPPNASAGTGYGIAVLDNMETTIGVALSFSGLTTAATAGHIHGPAPAGMNAPVLFNLAPPPATSGAVTPALFAITPTQIADMKNGLYYFNVHSSTFPGGEIRGQMSKAQYFHSQAFSGANEVPPNASPGTGNGTVTLENFETTITVFMRFSGLTANATAGHIHGPAPAGMNAPVIFNMSPPASTSGTAGPTSFTITPTQVNDLKTQLNYFNVHTSTFPGGEIRGQITTVVVPVGLSGFEVK